MARATPRLTRVPARVRRGAQAKAKAAASEGKPTQKAKDWAERNVAGAASEEDATLIRGMNEFLQ